MSLSDELRDYFGQRELETLLVEFVEWLGDKDIFLSAPEYEEVEFDIRAWARRKYPDQKLENRSDCSDARSGQEGICPECNDTEYGFLSKDYICLMCRAKMVLLRQGSYEMWTGVDEDGNELTFDERYSGDNITVRKPIPGTFTTQTTPVDNLAFWFLRYKAERLGPSTSEPKVTKANEIPF